VNCLTSPSPDLSRQSFCPMLSKSDLRLRKQRDKSPVTLERPSYFTALIQNPAAPFSETAQGPTPEHKYKKFFRMPKLRCSFQSQFESPSLEHPALANVSTGTE